MSIPDMITRRRRTGSFPALPGDEPLGFSPVFSNGFPGFVGLDVNIGSENRVGNLSDVRNTPIAPEGVKS
jgi:hypothetical protein